MKILFTKYWPFVWIFALWFSFASPYFIKHLVPFPARYLADFFPPWNNLYGHPVKNNAMPDVISQIYPWKTLVIDAWKNGQVPRWNPHSFSGNPLLAGVQSAPFFFLNFIYFILPFIDAWSIQILLQPLLSGLFMYMFLRRVDRTQYASLFGSIAFMFSGFFVVWMAYGTLGYAFLFTPLALYYIESLYISDVNSICESQNAKVQSSKIKAHSKLKIQNNNKSVHFSVYILLSISIAFSLFSGHFQTSLYSLIVISSYSLWKWYETKNIRRFGLILLSLIVGIILAFPQILPALRFYNQSVRSELFQKGEVIPWKYLPTTIAPDFYGNPVTRNDWFGHYAEWASYIGVIPVIFALWFFLGRKWRRDISYYFVLLFTVSFFLAFDSPLGNLLVMMKLPVLSTSSMSRIIVITSFSLVVLSSFGFDQIISNTRDISVKSFFIIPVFLIFLMISICISLVRTVFGMNPDQSWIAVKNLILPIMISSVLFILIFLKKKILFLLPVIIFLLLIITSFDLYRYASKWMPFDERVFVYPKMDVLEYMKINAGVNRVFGIIGNEALSMNGLYGIEGYDPLYITRYGEFITAASNGKLESPSRSLVQINKNGQFTKRILNLLGVRFYFHSKGDGRNIWVFPFWNYLDSFGSPVYSDDYYELYENKKALPRAYISRFYTVKQERQEIIDSILSGPEDNAVLVLEEEIPEITPENIVVISRDAIKEALIKRYTANDIIITVQTDAPSILYLSDSWYPGWRALVNNVPTKIYRANFAFRAVPIPLGESEVRFFYDNWSY